MHLLVGCSFFAAGFELTYWYRLVGSTFFGRYTSDQDHVHQGCRPNWVHSCNAVQPSLSSD
jgi:hypothetical protein